MRPNRKSLQIALAVCRLASLGLTLTAGTASRPGARATTATRTTTATATATGHPLCRDPDSAPDLKVKDLDGRELTLQTYRGKVVLLNSGPHGAARAARKFPA